MYQFSATPKHIECVVFESVGGRDNNQGLAVKVGFALHSVSSQQPCMATCTLSSLPPCV
jgi:hypothetical protein